MDADDLRIDRPREGGRHDTVKTMHAIGRSTAGSGFTLIELTFALMIVALGLLAIFHLFPSGLRASVDANALTRQGQFGNEVFGAVRTKAVHDFAGARVSVDIGLASPINLVSGTWSAPVEYPADAGEYLRYKSEVTSPAPYLDRTSDRLFRVKMQVRYGRVGTFEEVFYTEIYDYGM